MKYIVEKVPSNWLSGKIPEEGVYYCHEKGFDYIPVFGSIGTKAKATEICRLMNGQKSTRAKSI